MTSVCLCEHQELRQEIQNEAQITTRWGTIFNDPSFLQRWRQQIDRSVLNTKNKLEQVRNQRQTNPPVKGFYPLQSIVYRLRVIDISIKDTRPVSVYVMGRNCLDWLGQFFKQQVHTWQLLRTGVSYQSILRTRQCLSISLHVCCTRIIDQSDSTRTE